MGHDFKSPGFYSALGLLVNHLPGRQLMGHQLPLAAAPHNIAQCVEEFAQRIFTWGASSLICNR